MTSITEDSLIRREIPANDWCRHLGTLLSQRLPPPKGSRPIYSWREFEWFWFKLSRPSDQAPGEWALMRGYDISDQVTHEEGVAWGGGALEFSREIALTGGGCSNIQSDEQYVLTKSIRTELRGNYKSILTQLESSLTVSNNFLYSDPDELRLDNISTNMLRQRRAWLLEVIQAYLNVSIKFRVSLPDSHDLPNRKMMDAFLGGWIPVDYVGPLRTGSAVVFHPAIKGP